MRSRNIETFFVVTALMAFTGCLQIRSVIRERESLATPTPYVPKMSVFAGQVGAPPANVDGMGGNARFGLPIGMAIDLLGNLYVADGDQNTIRKITPAGMVTTIAGTAGVGGAADGPAASATFYTPFGVTLDHSNGDLYVTDFNNNTIRKISGGVVSTVAGNGTSGSNDGAAASARFTNPCGIAVDINHDLYVVDGGNSTIRKISAGVVSTLAGTASVNGWNDGAGAAAHFNGPVYLAFDGGGDLLVADSNNHLIRRVTLAGVVTTIAGDHTQSGFLDGTGTAAHFSYPYGLSVDLSGTVYIADSGNQLIRKMTSGAVVSRYAGTPGMSGSHDDDNFLNATFNYPYTTAVDPITGTLYVSDAMNRVIRKMIP